MYRCIYSLLIRTATTAGLAMLYHGASAQDISFSLTGALDAYVKSSETASPTNLVPIPPKEASSGVEAILQFSAQADLLTVGSQLRFADDSETDAESHIDEAYAEWQLDSHIFAYAGRRILVWGQSYGLNPADVFQDPLRENPVFPQARARGRIEGADMAGGEILFDSGSALSLVYAPSFDRRDNEQKEDLALARFSSIAFGGSLDYALSAIGGDLPGLGTSVNYVVGSASVIYLDGTFRKGRERQTVAAISSAGMLMTELRDDDKYNPYVTLGLGHAFDNGLTANLELSHDAGGYSTSEWDSIASAIELVTPVASALHGQSLGQLNHLLNHYTLRQHYAFARVAHDQLLGSKFSAEATALHGIDDESGTLGFRLEYPVAEKFTLGLRAARNYGVSNTEFTIRPAPDTFALYAGVTF